MAKAEVLVTADARWALVAVRVGVFIGHFVPRRWLEGYVAAVTAVARRLIRVRVGGRLTRARV